MLKTYNWQIYTVFITKNLFQAFQKALVYLLLSVVSFMKSLNKILISFNNVTFYQYTEAIQLYTSKYIYSLYYTRN